MPDPKADFIIAMTLEQAERAETALQLEGIDFDPTQSIIETDPYDDSYFTMRSSDLPHLISQMNDHLHDHYPSYSVPDPVSLPQIRDALNLAYWGFEWNRQRVTKALWPLDGATWADVQRRYPALFGTNPVSW